MHACMGLGVDPGNATPYFWDMSLGHLVMGGDVASRKIIAGWNRATRRSTEERILALPTSDSFPRPVFRFQPSKTLPGDWGSRDSRE